MSLLVLTTTIANELGHNTSANSAYNETDFAANFGTSTWVNNTGSTISVDPTQYDLSLNAITPCHVSPVSIKTLIPSYSGKWYAHLTPWFHSGGGGGHIDIGVNCDSTGWVSAMLNDVKARGFDGVIIDWYGLSDYTNSVALLIQTFLSSNPGFGLTYTIMIDTGAYTSTATLQTQANYVQSQYLSDANYTKQGGNPVLMFWGPGVGGVNYTTVRSVMGISMYWMFQGPGCLVNSWVDGCYDWVQPYSSGVNMSDPYNSTAALAYYGDVNGNAKGAMQCISAGFNGMLTGTTAWSKGKYMPRDNGKCWLTQAALINSNLCSNAVGIQVPTWDDWEEGSEIESAIQNNIAVVASVTGSTLNWSVSGGTGDETTISEYLILASPDGVNAAILWSQAVGGSKSFNLASITGWLASEYSIYVIAVGKPCIRSQYSSASYIPPVAPGGGGGGGGTAPVSTPILAGPSMLPISLEVIDSLQVVPLDTFPNQTWKVSVSVNGGVQTFLVALRYNAIAGYWVMTIYNSQGVLLLDSLPMITGLNILQQYGYLQIGSIFVLNISGTAGNYPDNTNLGSDFILAWGDNA
jgi:hypothetical protein